MPIGSANGSITLYINAGGRGTRLSSVFPRHNSLGIAKALLEVGEPSIPLIDHHLNASFSAGYSRVVVGAGDQRAVAEHVNAQFDQDPRVRVHGTRDRGGTAGDLADAILTMPEAFSPTFVVKNVDTVVDIDDLQLVKSHVSANHPLTLAVSVRSDCPNFGAIKVDSDQRIVASDEARPGSTSVPAADVQQYSSTGVMVVETELIRYWASSQDSTNEPSLYVELLQFALNNASVGSYNNRERYFIDVGTPGAWAEAHVSSEFQRQLCYNTPEYIDINGGGGDDD